MPCRWHTSQIPHVNRRLPHGNATEVVQKITAVVFSNGKLFPNHLRQAHSEQLKLNKLLLVSTRCCGKRRFCECVCDVGDVACTRLNSQKQLASTKNFGQSRLANESSNMRVIRIRAQWTPALPWTWTCRSSFVFRKHIASMHVHFVEIKLGKNGEQ